MSARRFRHTPRSISASSSSSADSRLSYTPTSPFLARPPAPRILHPPSIHPNRAKLLTYTHRGRLAYVPADYSHAAAIAYAQDAFRTLARVPQASIVLSVADVAVAPNAWAQLVADLPNYAVVHVRARRYGFGWLCGLGGGGVLRRRRRLGRVLPPV
ncbi:hypothetical protein K488DRAFT_90328 [Vararia minispora EC-137]|uniref:Uncharacterized protein n=1 Tax=Vararia minispora EC-137 TaxID=1314806 RepID=A0ACB8Q8I0_9AGAM|nr:hypothetical protein K488DRAFT_90328 [Vararia minispora EC-137]